MAAVEIIRSLNKKAAVITTPVEKLAGEKILDIMENNRSLEKELMEEETCPVCGGHHHEHEHHHHDHEECGCGHDHHDHHEHEHHHDGECGCGHDHDHEHHHHDGECSCGYGMTMIAIIIITMQMECLQAGVRETAKKYTTGRDQKYFRRHFPMTKVLV